VTRRAAGLPAVLAVGVLLAGCTGGAAAEQRLVVLAGSSLTEVLQSAAEGFERDHPGVRVVLQTGSSAALAQQVVAGAPADVLATAGRPAMQVVVDAGRAASPPVVVARNALQIAVPPGNPRGVTGLDDFARDDLLLAVCALQAPCGQAAQEAFTRRRVAPRPDTYERDVKSVLGKVRLGEVDAGLVYVSDVHSAGGDVDGVALPPAHQVLLDHPVVVLADAPQPALAQRFVQALLSAEGRAAFAAAGFRSGR
jgi:molybdate transport system substrate-binding protein